MMMTAFCDLAESFHWQEARPGFYGADIDIRHEPVGVVAAIAPWNMPQFLIVTKLIPALLAGCCVVVKPAPESPLDARLLAAMLEEACLPEGVVSMLSGDAKVGQQLIGHPGVDKVSFTGSTRAGKAVAAACAADLKRVSLSNCGQIGNALTRILLPANRGDQFVDALAAEMGSLRIGDPADPATQLGPLVAQRP